MLSPHSVDGPSFIDRRTKTPSQAERFIYRYDWFIATQTHRSHMDIRRKITQGKSLTPPSNNLGERPSPWARMCAGLSIKEFAARANVSVCERSPLLQKARPRGLQRPQGRAHPPGDRGGQPARRGHQLSLRCHLHPCAGDGAHGGALPDHLGRNAGAARPCTARPRRQAHHARRHRGHLHGSHNLYPAGMFRDRLLSAGKSATCHDSVEAQVRTALASGPDHVAIIISYSGLAPNLKEILPILSSRHVPVIVIGTPYCARIHPGFAALSHGKRPREHDAPHHAVRQPYRRAIRTRFAL